MTSFSVGVSGLLRPLGLTVAGTALMAIAVPAVALADPLPATCSGTTRVTCTFAYNGTTGIDGSPQTWTVPSGVTSAYFDLLGAQGGLNLGFNMGLVSGGLGGETTGTLAVTPGSMVTVFVGGAGASQPEAYPTNGGFNGGANGAAGGGGASDIRVGGEGLSNRILVAGGGGGAGRDCPRLIVCPFGGAGGGAVGGDAQTTRVGDSPLPASTGGTQTGGGIAQTDAQSGASGQGGQEPSTTSIPEDSYGGGGGGGGFFGGGGGGYIAPVTAQDKQNRSAAESGGGGGSGYFSPDPTRVTGGSTADGIQEGNGLVRITYTIAPPTATTTTVSSSQNPAAPGRSVTFTATVGPNDGSGTVAFFADDSSTPISGCDAVPLTDNSGSWDAACTVASGFPTGTHPVTASYSGSALYAPSSGTLLGGQKVSSGSTSKPSLRIADASGPEGNSGTHPLSLRVTLSKASRLTVAVRWSTANGTAKAPSDYVAANGVLTFSPGQTSRTILVQIKGDRVKESNEVFYVLMRDPTNATIADPNASGGIFNDD